MQALLTGFSQLSTLQFLVFVGYIQMALLLWCMALNSLRTRSLTERDRFLWTVLVTVLPVAGPMAYYMVEPCEVSATVDDTADSKPAGPAPTP